MGAVWLFPPSFIDHTHCELKLMHVVARDLIQRAVIPGLIVAANHQPIGRIGMAQHGVGDGLVVLDLAFHREAGCLQGLQPGAGRRRLPLAEGAGPHRELRPVATERICTFAPAVSG